MASSSKASSSEIIPKNIPSSVSPKLYDVFINHRGPDVKENLARPLYNHLQKMRIQAFLDSEEFKLGDPFPPIIRKAIFSSSLHIAILSKGYAGSPWCLEELDLMLQTNAMIIPVFYDVEAWELRYIEKGAYKDAFKKYKKKGRYLNELEKWKKALKSISYNYGYEFSKHDRDVDKLCEKVVQAVREEVDKRKPCLYVAKHPVALGQIVADFEQQCMQNKEEEKVQIVGIYAMGGAGKTTLAKELFTRKWSEFNGSCFLSDVREASVKDELPSLQKKLLKDLFNDSHEFRSTDEGKSYLRDRLERGRSLRFLIVIDDIDHRKQLDALLFTDTLNSRSLVIITTRNERLLIGAGIASLYKMQSMGVQNSRQLFCWHAFGNPEPESGYGDLVESFLKECGGLPLSLQVLGSHVCGSDKRYWQLELNKVKQTLDEDIKHKLKISFDSLDREQRQIFMDTACFFIGKEKRMAIRIWEGSGWSAEHALQTLQDKCLVVVNEDWGSTLRMHDHLRDLGREMADELRPPRRLWRPQDLKSLEEKGLQNVLTEASRNSFRCLCLRSQSDIDNMGVNIKYFLGNSDDCHETSTALLWLEGETNSLTSGIPSWIPLQNLQTLIFWGNDHERLWQRGAQAPSQLKELKLVYKSMLEFPHSFEMLKSLEKLEISRYIYNTIQSTEDKHKMVIEGTRILKSIRKLPGLQTMFLQNFLASGELALKNSGESVTFEQPMSRLEEVCIEGQSFISKISISGAYCSSLQSLSLVDMTSLMEVDLTGVATLNRLELKRCVKLKRVSGISDMRKLRELIIRDCPELKSVLTGIEELEELRILFLANLAQRRLLDFIHKLQRLPLECLIFGGREFDRGVSRLKLIGAIFTEIHINFDEDRVMALLKMPHSWSAIFILVRAAYGFRGRSDLIFTCVITDQSKLSDISNSPQKIDTYFEERSGPGRDRVRYSYERGFIVTVKKGEEGKVIDVLKMVCRKVYRPHKR